jgi:hypothetical protein
MAKEKTTAFQVRVTGPFLERLDAWRARQRPIISRSEAVRVIVEKTTAKVASQ